MKNGLDEQYIDLLNDILENGIEKDTRNGKTLSVFGRQFRYKFKDGKFPLLTTKKMAFKTMVVELLWFLRGDTSIKYLLENNCNIWTGDAYKRYTNKFLGYEDVPSKEWFINEIKTDDEFAEKFGNLGKIYGYQWRNFNGEIDQISELIMLLKESPDSRRMVVNAWNASDLPHQVLPPCHYGFQVYTRELSHKERCDLFGHNDNIERDYSYSKWLDDNGYPKRAISLMYNCRSQDVPLGTPYNISSYSLLLMMMAKQVNMVPDELIANMGDCHIYKNQIDGVKEQITKEPYPLPTVTLSDRIVNDISEYTLDDIKLENYQSHQKIYFPLSN
jgi:thymidylate synthase